MQLWIEQEWKQGARPGIEPEPFAPKSKTLTTVLRCSSVKDTRKVRLQQKLVYLLSYTSFNIFTSFNNCFRAILSLDVFEPPGDPPLSTGAILLDVPILLTLSLAIIVLI